MSQTYAEPSVNPAARTQPTAVVQPLRPEPSPPADRPRAWADSTPGLAPGATLPPLRPLRTQGGSMVERVAAKLDGAVAAGVLLAASWAITGLPGSPEAVLALIAFALSQRSAPNSQSRLLNWLGICLLLLAVGAATDTLRLFDARILTTWAVLTPALQLGVQWTLPRLQGQRTQARAVIVGANPPGRTLARTLLTDRRHRISLLGYFDDRMPQRLGTGLEAALLGHTADLAEFVSHHRVDRIYVALPLASQPRIHGLLGQLRDTTASVYFVPDLLLAEPIQARVEAVGGLPVVAVCETPFCGSDAVIKRASDIGLALSAILMLWPMMAAIALAIRLTMPGPVLFRQHRYGLDGEPIEVWKFRSMRVAEDGAVVRQAVRGDSRITPLGAFLRRTSLDELPQLFNVLQGRMSMVGPRPHAVAHNEFYRKLIPGYMVRHKVKPGITGWAQVNGARGETDTVEKMQRRIDYDLQYLREWSIALDLKILWRTVVVTLRGDENAY